MLQIVKIDSSYPIHKVIKFCEYSKTDILPGNVNFCPDDWENNSHTLLFLIYKEQRYNGDLSAYIGLELDGDLIAGAGYYPLDQDSNVANINSRYYTIPAYRNKVYQGTHILPKMMKEVSSKFSVALFSYNTYNIWLKNALERINNNKAAFLGIKTPEEYKGWVEISAPLMIKNTPQLCYYKLFDRSYETTFLTNIESIKITENIDTLLQIV